MDAIACLAKQAADLSALKPWLKGELFSDLSKAVKPVFGRMKAVREEEKLLKNQQLMHKLTGGLSDKPFFHVQDRLAGGAVGGMAGYSLDDKLRNHDQSLSDRLNRAASTLLGAWTGGKALNAGMNVGRKYIANTSPIFGYDTREIPKLTLKGLWEHGVKDIPIKAGERRGSLEGQARLELLRRYLGIHKNDPAKDFFVQKADRSFGFNPAVSDKWRGAMNEASFYANQYSPFKNEYLGEAPDFSKLARPPRYNTESNYNPVKGIFGSHDLRHVPGTAQHTGTTASAVHELGDAWNFALDPHETPEAKAYLKGLLKTSPQKWKQYLQQGATLSSQELATPDNVGDRLKQFGVRELMEKIFRQQTPVVRQKLKFEYANKQPAKITPEW